MNIFRTSVTVILLLASIALIVVAFMGHEAAWSSAAVCGCSAAITSDIWKKRFKNR
ncbi:MAG: hypothetical protein K2O04_02045 [Clostridiales bacterium]|nr:hypothetical protein [Clostridiales bacterium]